jgi:uncharacterized protein
MARLQVGTVDTLIVDREVPFGYFLTNEDEDVLLHQSEITEDIEIGDSLKVFLFHDKEVRIAATMRIPKVQIGSYSWAEVVDVAPDLGVFVSIGLTKDILISADDLPIFESLWPAPGDQLYISLKTDKNDRLYGRLATENIIGQIARRASNEMMKATITGRVYRLLKVGTYVLSEQGYRCFIHESQRKSEPRLGELVTGRVIDVKEDGSLNVSFLPLKQDKMGDDSGTILAYLNQRNGAMPFSDKSLPEEIKERFQMSKASFKRALGKLMKDRVVYQKDGWTYLNKKEEE